MEEEGVSVWLMRWCELDWHCQCSHKDVEKIETFGCAIKGYLILTLWVFYYKKRNHFCYRYPYFRHHLIYYLHLLSSCTTCLEDEL